MTPLAVAKQCCLTLGVDKTYWIAFSGGLDSHVLLDAFCQLRQQYPLALRAIHINHNLSPQAAAWGLHCKAICDGYGVTLEIHSIHLYLNEKDSLEEAARHKRYAVFADRMGEQDVLLTAHHEDDQAETMLIQLLRGAGIKGLAAMPAIKAFAQGFHARPFLQLPRTIIKSYAEGRGLTWIEDESNLNTQLTRNFIRHELFPLLQTRWPTASSMIVRSAGHCAESQELLEELALVDCKNVAGSKENTLSVQGLLQLSEARQRLALRTWITGLQFLVPNSKKLREIQESVLTASMDAMPLVSWRGAELRRYRDDLYLMVPGFTWDLSQEWLWDLNQSLALPSGGKLSAALVKGCGIKSELQQLTVRFRQGGEMVPFLKRGTKALKQLFQEWGVPPWERARVPLLFDGEELVGVVGYFLREDYRVAGEKLGWEVGVE
jgi:tRNA(Ile)-lysidine synthase